MLRGLLAAALCTVAAVQAQDQTRLLTVRVLSGAASGAALIDRGSVDKVEIGDVVQLRPRDGTTIRGRVVRVDARSSLIELDRRELQPVPGTPGDLRVPMSRYRTEDPVPAPTIDEPVSDPSDDPVTDPGTGADPVDPSQPDPATDDPADPPRRPVVVPPADPVPTDDTERRWTNQDRNYRRGQPLLAQAIQPNERAMRISGRVYGIADVTRHFEGGAFEQSFGRVGIGVDIDNPAGQGGRFESLIETNYRREFDEDEGANVFVRRLSYTYGGTRFNRNRVQIGRFLQYGFPEFSTIDGAQYSRRVLQNSEFGVSAGFLPEVDDDFNSFNDFQTSVWYLWKSDQYATTTVGAGYQFVAHQGKTDRNLLVVKADTRPNDDWFLSARVHGDIPDGNDQFRNEAILLSQVVAQATRTWDGGSFMRFGYRRLALPEIQRFEFIPPQLNELANDRYDRVFFETSYNASESSRWHTYEALFTDEDFTGGAAEGGLEMIGFFGEDTSLDVTLFGNYSRNVTSLGGRVYYRRMLEGGALTGFYEFADNNEREFVAEVSTVQQHRLRISRSFYTSSGWDADIYGETQVIGQDITWSLGLYFQRRF